MGVEVRVTSARRAVPERRRDEPVTVEDRVTALAPPDPARGLLEAAQRGADCGVSRVANLVGHLRSPPRQQQADGLRRTPRPTQPTHRRPTPPPRQPLKPRPPNLAHN